jgi:hypothetical protein
MLTQIYEVSTAEEASAISAMGVNHVDALVGDGQFPRELPVGRRAAQLSSGPEQVARMQASQHQPGHQQKREQHPAEEGIVECSIELEPEPHADEQ